MSEPQPRPQYLRVRNWATFQHYKNRRPPWIKYFISSLDDYELTSLAIPTRLLYKELLLVAAITDDNIPNDHAWISERVHLTRKVVAVGVEELVAAGFLLLADRKQVASGVLAERLQDASGTLASRASPRSREAEAEGQNQNLKDDGFALPEASCDERQVPKQIFQVIHSTAGGAA